MQAESGCYEFQLIGEEQGASLAFHALRSSPKLTGADGDCRRPQPYPSPPSVRPETDGERILHALALDE